MPTYYPGPDVMITDKAFTVLGDRPIRFRIADLVDPYIVRGSRHPVGVVTGRFAIGSVVAGTIGWPMHDSTAFHLAMLVVVVSPALAAGAYFRTTGRPQQLRAVHEKIDVCLYSTTNEQRFGQIRRALVRALEEHRGQHSSIAWLRELER